jgi:hypothetical protein
MFLLCGLVWLLYRYAEGLSRPDCSDVEESDCAPAATAASE